MEMLIIIGLAVLLMALLYRAKRKARIDDIRRFRHNLADKIGNPMALEIFDLICKWSRFFRLPLDRKKLQKEAVASLARYIEHYKEEQNKFDTGQSSMAISKEMVALVKTDSDAYIGKLYGQLAELQLRLVGVPLDE
jgi:hypothetical protein